MGMTVSGTVTYGRPLIASLASLPSITIALSQAIIDKAYLTWLDVSKLQAAFPAKVQVLGDTVILEGPVMLVSAMGPIRRLFIQSMLAIIAGVVSGVLINRIFQYIIKMDSENPSKKEIMVNRIVVLSTLSVALAVLYTAGRYLPTQAGVYFYKEPPFYV